MNWVNGLIFLQFMLGVITFVILFVFAACVVAGKSDEAAENYRKEGQKDGSAGIFGTNKETGQDDPKQTE